MKKLILPLILMPFLAHAVQEMGMGLSDAEIKKKFVSKVKDVQVEKLLGASAEFNKCRELGKFEATDDKDKKTIKLNKANECFKTELSKKSDADLKKLSGSLGLQDYGLVKSNSVNDVTEYLQKKMTKSLTGRDPDEQNEEKIREQLKWKNTKIVDQKVFVDLYKNQLMKNALFEVSRYCFENLRLKTNKNVEVFAVHWPETQMSIDDTTGKITNLSAITDNGIPSFFPTKISDTSNKEIVYKDMLDSLSGGVEIIASQYERYFKYCALAMPELCNQYKDKIKIQATESSMAKTDVTPDKLTEGAASCLAMDRLRNIRKAMDNTDKVAKQFDEMEDKDGSMAIKMLQDPLQYQRGNGAGEESLDSLTAMTSSDMLVKSETNKDKAQLKEDCEAGKSTTECDDYLTKSDDFDQAITRTETEMTLKREIEVARVKQMKEKELKEYLTENGMFEILNDLENNPALDANAIAEKIGQIYEARKIATIEGLKLKVGKRQLSEADAKGKSDTELNNLKADNVKTSSEEKARLAQVVLFNNIITSQLSLQDKDGKSLGRNVTAWNKEVKGISKDGGIKEDDKLFKGLQDKASTGKKLENASLVDGGIIDTILGKKSKP